MYPLLETLTDKFFETLCARRNDALGLEIKAHYFVERIDERRKTDSAFNQKIESAYTIDDHNRVIELTLESSNAFIQGHYDTLETGDLALSQEGIKTCTTKQLQICDIWARAVGRVYAQDSDMLRALLPRNLRNPKVAQALADEGAHNLSTLCLLACAKPYKTPCPT